MREVNTALIHIDEYIELLNFKKEIKKNSILVNSLCGSGRYEIITRDKAVIALKKKMQEKDFEIHKLKKQLEDYDNTIKQLSGSEVNKMLNEYTSKNRNLEARTDCLLNYIRELLLTSRWSLNKFKNEVKTSKYIGEYEFKTNPIYLDRPILPSQPIGNLNRFVSKYSSTKPEKPCIMKVNHHNKTC